MHASREAWALPERRAVWLLLGVALAAYLNTLGNAFAYDDNWFIVENPVVTEGRLSAAWTEPSWPQAPQGMGNYRPLALTSFALEWRLWDGNPVGFHAVNVATHALVTLLVFLLLGSMLPAVAAWWGAAWFAVHPVHVEAVANVMGRAELYAAAAYLGAVLVYLRWRPAEGVPRGVRLLALCGLFALALSAKEIALTLPAVLVLLEWLHPARRSDPTGAGLPQRLGRELPTLVALTGVLAVFVLVRWEVLGVMSGRPFTPGMTDFSPWERRLTSFLVWPEYVRLLLLPLDLSVDYGPAVLLPARSLAPDVLLGGLLLAGAVGSVPVLARRLPVLALGVAWFVCTVLPVSNLIWPLDVLLAERTLYLPSVGAAVAVGAMVELAAVEWSPRRRQAGAVALALVLTLLLVRTVLRNPTWADTYTVVNTLAHEHPESWVALRARAAGLRRVGALEEAADVYDVALRIVPDHYGLLVEAARLQERLGGHARAERLLARAVRVLPDHPAAWIELAEQRLRRGEGRRAHAAAVEGLRVAGPHPALFAALSESYVARGDLDGALRAREAALALEPDNPAHRERMAELRAMRRSGGA